MLLSIFDFGISYSEKKKNTFQYAQMLFDDEIKRV